MVWFSKIGEEQRRTAVGLSITCLSIALSVKMQREEKRNLSMAWVEVAKAYNSVDHRWLQAMFNINRFPQWIGAVMKKLAASYNTRIFFETKQSRETSEIIRFKKGLPQGDALCPALFTLCLNPIPWKLRATEGYKLSRPISQKVTHLLFIDDLKADNKLERVFRVVKNGMEFIGLKLN